MLLSCNTYNAVIKQSGGKIRLDWAVNCNRVFYGISVSGVVEIDGKDYVFEKTCYEAQRCAISKARFNPAGSQKFISGWDPQGTEAYYGKAVEGASDRLRCKSGIDPCSAYVKTL
ncbi:hypothetical protein GCM10009719_31850 [Nocardioides kribbensis]